MAVDALSKYNLLTFSTSAIRAVIKQKQYQSNVHYANALCNFYLSQQNLPFQNKSSCDNFVLGLKLTAYASWVKERYTKPVLTSTWRKYSLTILQVVGTGCTGLTKFVLHHRKSWLNLSIVGVLKNSKIFVNHQMSITLLHKLSNTLTWGFSLIIDLRALVVLFWVCWVLIVMQHAGTNSPFHWYFGGLQPERLAFKKQNQIFSIDVFLQIVAC